tara:strand:+ start:5023 stop:6111 length:1089 start_codon:yes stop_codon:yes gene_type:complete
MEDKYKINDDRTIKVLLKKSFSGYKKKDVIDAVLKSIEKKKIENACYWTTECIVSGYTLTLWEKLIIFSSKIIHINNPKLPFYLYCKGEILANQVNRLKKDEQLLIRNSQMIRNLFFDVISTLSTSLKTKRYDNLPKIDEKEDFDFQNIQKRLFSTMNILPDHIIHFNDPDELRIICNEFYTLLKNKQFGYEKCCYWILWIQKWESMHKKNKTVLNINHRKIEGVSKKYTDNIIWIFWELIMIEVDVQKNTMISKQINSLYSLFKNGFTNSKRNSRLPIVFNAIGYLTHNISFNSPLRDNYHIFIQVQSNVNKMFHLQKQNEKKNTNNHIQSTPPIKENLKHEIVNDKISLFNQIDIAISKK